MSGTRREFLRGAIGWGGLLLAGSFKLLASRDHPSLRTALRFLAAQQSPDGAWRSERYAAFREGDALTPLIVWGLQAAPATEGAGAVLDKAYRWLEDRTDAQSQSAEPWTLQKYPLFTASYAAQVFAQAGDKTRAQVWANQLQALRLQAALGWPVDDPAAGAWSDAPAPPRYSQPVPDMLEANISATRLAVEGLAAAGRTSEAQAALPFVSMCQNFSGVNPASTFDDGGFFFALNDSIRNKAGSAGRDATGRTRFRSYGSATCDGLIALLACGLPFDDPRCRAAMNWLRRNGAGLAHAGRWEQGRAAARESLVYYHAEARAVVLAQLQHREKWAENQARQMVQSLAAAQEPEGSWRGHAPQSCEDDPLLATAFAFRALASLV